MKKFIQFILCIAIAAFVPFSSSCTTKNPQKKFLIKYMNSIPVEVEGYQISDTYTEGAIHLNTCEDNEFIVQGISVTLQTLYRKKMIPVISFNGTTVEITHEFLLERSEVYRKIHKMWLVYKNEEENTSLNQRSEIVGIRAYNDALFIRTDAADITAFPLFSPMGQYPAAVFQYDIINDQILYVGYYDTTCAGGGDFPFLYLSKN